MTRSRQARTLATFGALAASCLVSLGLAAEAWAKPKPRKPPPAAPSPVVAPEATPARTSPGAATVDAKPVNVTVVEVAGSRAYIRPGGAAGLRRGATAVIRGKTYRVVESSDSFAVLDTGDEPLREQDQGRAIGGQESLKAVELPAPHPVAAWEHEWTPEEAPADAQRPQFVPLGGDERNRRFDVRVSLSAGGSIPLGGQVGSALAYGELNARVHAEPFAAAPLKLDFDGSLQGWASADLASRVGGPTRSLVFVRELLASYTLGGFYAGLGRMRYASSTLGTLDGARVQKDLGDGFSLAAFGGLVPNPLNGNPSLDAQRFGVEARYSRPDLALRPEAALVVHGSMFQGTLDERRLSALFSAYPGPSRVGGYIEVSNFDASNPWNQSTFAITGAGLDESLRLGGFELGARLDVRQPELSNWLASYLPTSWFCTTVPAPGSNPTLAEPCNGNISSRGSGELDVRYVAERFSVGLAGTAVKDLGQSDAADMVGGLATARIMAIPRRLRVEASGNFSRATYMDMYGGTVGPGLVLFDDALDVSIYYRLSVLAYRSVTTSLVQNGVGGTVAFFPKGTVFFTLQGEGVSGDDVSALTLFATATWRPRL